MIIRYVGVVILGSLFAISGFAQGPCFVQSSNLACVISQEYGAGPAAFSGGQPKGSFSQVLEPFGGHPIHFSNEFAVTLQPLTAEIGREANLLPLASPSSGVVLVYDPSLKSFVTATDSLGPVLGERAETVGRHHLFIGFSYQFFNFDKLDGIKLNNFPAVLTHTADNMDNSNSKTGVTRNCSLTGSDNLGSCSFVRDRIDTAN